MVSSTTPQQTTDWVETPPRSPAIRRWTGSLIARMPWLDKLSEPFQHWIHTMYGKPGEPGYKVKDAMNGTWLGHPLHPVLVDIPIGAWTGTLLFDLIWLSDSDKGMARGSDILLWTGLAGAAGSAVTGATNWVDTDGPERRTGMLHAVLNGGATVLNMVSAILRLTGQRRSAIALSTTAYLITAGSAYLGGELAYSMAIGVNRVAGEGGSSDFVPVMDVKELPQRKLTRVDAAGIPVVLYKDGSRVYALAATCSHLGGPLDEGHCENGVVHCPWHNSGFRLEDGSVANSPALYAQPTFEVRTRSGKIEVRRREHA